MATVCLTPEQKANILTGELINAENKSDIITGSLLDSEHAPTIETGDLLTPESINDIESGNVLNSIALPVTSEFPLNYARIGYDSILINGAASADFDVVGAANMITPSTYDKWVPGNSSASAVIIANNQGQVNYIGIAAYYLIGATLVVSVALSTGPIVEVFNGVITNNTPLFIRFTESTYDRVLIDITGATDAEIGIVFMGKELEMMRPNYSGYSPATLSSKDVFTPQMSDGGQFLGKQLVRKGFSTQASFRHLEYSWYESEFQPFVIAAKTRPYFWAWNLLEHPNEVVYGWTNQNITPSLMGVRNWLEVSFDIDAHGNL